MSLTQKIQVLFSNHSETRDKHQDQQLKSHYYKTTNKKAMEAVKEVLEKMDGFHITSVSEERGEISVSVRKGKKAFMVITVISVRPFETAIDFAVSTETAVLPIDFGFSRKLIIELYSRLDKVLPYIGSGEGR